jgi:riboflavin kinase/FMN adenylyltransferase
MQILRGLHSPDPRPVALTIGNFDGVHVGHRALLAELRDVAVRGGLVMTVVIFEPHAREFFSPEQAPARLSSLREKLEQFRALGVERVHVCRFNSQFAQMSAADFMHALHRDLHAKFVLIGDDFRFGKGRTGDFALMEKVAGEEHFAVRAMHSVLAEGVRVSSTGIRIALAAGQLEEARHYLGVHYSMSGRVVHGDGMGRQLGFPTANIRIKHNRPPLSGIYVVRAHAEGLGVLQGVASLGVRPTVHSNGKPVLEAHLFEFDRQIYGRHLRVEFLQKIRDEARYPDLESLTQQIALDVAHAKNWFEQHE